jgi:hypothetical protein
MPALPAWNLKLKLRLWIHLAWLLSHCFKVVGKLVPALFEGGFGFGLPLPDCVLDHHPIGFGPGVDIGAVLFEAFSDNDA